MARSTQSIIYLIQQIPRGKVATYGQIAAMAGQLRGARQVVRILHTMSRNHALPWHRVVNRLGRISLPRNRGYEEQKARLLKEGVRFSTDEQIDLSACRWDGMVRRSTRCLNDQRKQVLGEDV